MPIQINELNILVEVQSSNEKSTGQSAPSAPTDSVMKGIKEMVRLLKDKNER